MMTGKHKGWHQRWRVDLAAATATHDGGLACLIERLPIEDPRATQLEAADWSGIGSCWAPDGRQWAVLAQVAPMQAVYESLRTEHGAHNAPQMLARLAREAGEVWVWHSTRT